MDKMLKITAAFFLRPTAKFLLGTIKKGDAEDSLGDNITPPPYKKEN